MRQERDYREFYTASGSDEPRNSCDRVCNPDQKAGWYLSSYEELKAAYDKYYAKERFVRVLKKGCLPGDQVGRGQQLRGRKLCH